MSGTLLRKMALYAISSLRENVHFQYHTLLCLALVLFHFHFIFNFLFTVAPSTKVGCFSEGRGKIPNYNVTKRKKDISVTTKGV